MAIEGYYKTTISLNIHAINLQGSYKHSLMDVIGKVQRCSTYTDLVVPGHIR
jgi:hypothetical protein